MIFSPKDEAQIVAHGLTTKIAGEQLNRFVTGFPDMQLKKPIEPGDGIRILSAQQVQHYSTHYEQQQSSKTILKFVPASGAASRMFKLLYNFLEGETSAEDEGIRKFYRHIRNFAFYEELRNTFSSAATFDDLVAQKDKAVVDALLSDRGLNYGKLPKALLSFHAYEGGTVRKAIDEHLLEGALYGVQKGGEVQLHFTVSEEHKPLIKQHLALSVPTFEAIYKVKYILSFSVQDKATDTLAVNPDNSPFRLENGDLLFRPGGHGALLKNLNELVADVLFIKNVDNVAAEWLVDDTVTHKKALAGVLLEVQETIFAYCRKINQVKVLAEKEVQEITGYLRNQLGYSVNDEFERLTPEKQTAFLYDKLNRPVRVCGVIEASNTGGGPFWVTHEDNAQSLQLVETAQVNLKNSHQTEILQKSSFANITDLVCGIVNFEGKKFDLMQYRDNLAGFIAEKSQGGKSLKAMELPGLWNGAMSDWNTIFVQVPVTTFNPVKTVLDLLNKEHQGMA